LLRALKKYNLENNEPYHLLIVCSRSVFSDRLKEIIVKEKMSKYVHFLGFVPDIDLREIYANSKAFVTPSKLEGFGLPGLESMASGAIVIAANSSCLPEIYQHGAIYFDPDDFEDLTSKLVDLNNMSESTRQRIINANVKYTNQFSWVKLAKETTATYEKLLA